MDSTAPKQPLTRPKRRDNAAVKHSNSEPALIGDIFNYCDRWCERCAFTSRCAVFQTEEGFEGSKRNGRDIRSKSFWRRLQATFEQTLALVEESAQEYGIDLTVLNPVPSANAAEVAEQICGDPLIEAASDYAERVRRWLESLPDESRFRVESLRDCDLGGDPDEGPQTVIDALAVVRWYQYQMAIKIVRAVSGRAEDLPSDESELTDADGSIKVALIGMDRSLAAWGVLQASLPSQADHIRKTLLDLERLRRATEHAFPNARHFVRPGFDSVPAQHIH